METVSAPGEPPLLRPRRGVLILGALFITYHLAAMLANGTPPALKERLWPAFAAYGDGLRMTGRFGVFARYTDHTVVAIHGVTADGQRYLLADTAPAQGSVLDARIYKIQRKFVHEDMREQFGQAYLRYFCRSAAERGLRFKKTEMELVGVGPGAKVEVVLSEKCRKRR